MIYIPNGDKVLLEKWEPDRTTSGGILMPGKIAEQIGSGRVVAVGQGSADLPMSVKVGDLVLFGARGCVPIDDYILISHLQVLCKCIEDGQDHKPKILAPAQKRIDICPPGSRLT